MTTLLGILLVVDLYVVVYYRLMVRFHYERHNRLKERTFGAIFSIPPWSRLDERGRIYAKRYWIAVIIMTAIVLYLGMTLNFTPFSGAR